MTFLPQISMEMIAMIIPSILTGVVNMIIMNLIQ